MTVRIYHNPRCSKSRKTLQLLTEHGIEPEIVAYLDEPPDAATVLRLADLLGLPVSDLLRTGEDDFVEQREVLDLGDDPALARWLQDHPRVLQRPIVVDEAAGRAVIGRPPEKVLELLPA
jgi:arsenate reductase